MDDDWDDDDFEDSDDDSAEVIDCPACGAAIYEDAPQCPECGEYVVTSTNIWSGRPAWWVVLGVAGMLAAIATMTLLF